METNQNTDTKYIVVTKQNSFSAIITETYKVLGILFILGVNHLKLNDSFFGALVLTVLFILTFTSLKPTAYKTLKTVKGEDQLKKYIKSKLNNQKNE